MTELEALAEEPIESRGAVGIAIRGERLRVIAGEPSPLEGLEIQYADYAVWQRAYLSGGLLEGEVGYWKERLKGAA